MSEHLQRVVLDGHPTLKLSCPRCGFIGYLDDDQAHGRISTLCEKCGYHETLDYWGIYIADEEAALESLQESEER